MKVFAICLTSIAIYNHNTKPGTERKTLRSTALNLLVVTSVSLLAEVQNVLMRLLSHLLVTLCEHLCRHQCSQNTDANTSHQIMFAADSEPSWGKNRLVSMEK